jgi:hypothetical protein
MADAQDVSDLREMVGRLLSEREQMATTIGKMKETLALVSTKILHMEEHTGPKDEADKMDAKREVQIFPRGCKYHKIPVPGRCPTNAKPADKNLQVSKVFAIALGTEPCAICFPPE